jgi:flagellar protein FliT
MRTAADVLASYRLLDVTVDRMLALARAREWQHLPALDARCAAIVHRLQSLEALPFSSGQRAELRRLACGIGRAQRQLAALVEPQFALLLRRLAELQPDGPPRRSPPPTA